MLHDGGNQLTRLEPVSETAKKVLDRVHDWYTDGGKCEQLTFLAAVAVEFGVIA